MIRRPPRSTQGVSSAASDVYKRQINQLRASNQRLSRDYMMQHSGIPNTMASDTIPELGRLFQTPGNNGSGIQSGIATPQNRVPEVPVFPMNVGDTPRSGSVRNRDGFPIPPLPAVHYDQDDATCPICHEAFQPGLRVSKLRCGHVFCSVCINNAERHWNGAYVHRETPFLCPCCRRTAERTALYNLSLIHI